MNNKEFFDDVKEAFETNREIYFIVNGIRYHLDYDDENDSCVFVFDDVTGQVFYDGTIKDIYDKFIIDGVSFGYRIENNNFDSFTII